MLNNYGQLGLLASSCPFGSVYRAVSILIPSTVRSDTLVTNEVRLIKVRFDYYFAGTWDRVQQLSLVWEKALNAIRFQGLTEDGTHCGFPRDVWFDYMMCLVPEGLEWRSEALELQVGTVSKYLGLV